MKLFSTLAAVAAVVTGQDGGVRVETARQQQPTVQPPAAAASTDAGSPAPRVEARPAGKAGEAPVTPPAQTPPAPAPDNTAELQRLRGQLDAQTAKLDAAMRELEQVRAELKAKGEAETRQSVSADTQRAAAATLGSVDQQLATGNSNVGAQLASVEASLGPSARANLQRAREALSNSDLPTARYYLSRAAAEAEAGR
jgi:hypothetical protein